MRLLLDAPSVHNKTDGHDEAPNAHDLEAMLWLEVALFDVLCCDLVAEMHTNELGKELTDS